MRFIDLIRGRFEINLERQRAVQVGEAMKVQGKGKLLKHLDSVVAERGKENWELKAPN